MHLSATEVRVRSRLIERTLALPSKQREAYLAALPGPQQALAPRTRERLAQLASTEAKAEVAAVAKPRSGRRAPGLAAPRARTMSFEPPRTLFSSPSKANPQRQPHHLAPRAPTPTPTPAPRALALAPACGGRAVAEQGRHQAPERTAAGRHDVVAERGGARSEPGRRPAPAGAAGQWHAREAPVVVTSDGLRPGVAPHSLRVAPACRWPTLRGHLRGPRYEYDRPLRGEQFRAAMSLMGRALPIADASYPVVQLGRQLSGRPALPTRRA